MLASENDALRGGKVGGVGDVLRDLPRALARHGWRTTVIVPSYGFLHRENAGKLTGTVSFPFAGKEELAETWDVTPRNEQQGVTILALHHAAISGEPIYFNDPPKEAFSRDAAKYALFCSAAGEYCRGIAGEYRLHLHDWHTGILFLLRELHPRFAHLKRVRTAFTIHNLAIQGTRPLTGPGSSVEQWFPELFPGMAWMSSWKDPRYDEICFTPMAAGIRCADQVNTVSPGYAAEILLPSDHAKGFYGGEGLESLLRAAQSADRLSGILNGTEYPPPPGEAPLSFDGLCTLMVEEAAAWNARRTDPVHALALERIGALRSRPPRIVLASITRIVEQKMMLLFERGTGGTAAIEEIAGLLEARDGLYVIQGSGTPEYESVLEALVRKTGRILFLKGYSERLARQLFRSGNLFLMPSSFEPCGIGQMVAMREHQPCVVHAVGGLKDTVLDGVNGFTFAGETLPRQADAFAAAVGRALALFFDAPERWNEVQAAAGAARFTWEKAARQYIERVYR